MKYRNWIGAFLVLLIVAIVVSGCVYTFKWLNKRDEIIPTDRSLGYDVATFVGVDTEFVISALERDGMTFIDITEPEQRAAGYTYMAMRENIQGLDFVTTLVFLDPTIKQRQEEAEAEAEEGAETEEAAEAAEETEESAEEGGVSGLINRIPLPGARSDVPRCIGYTKRWDSNSTDWTPAQVNGANQIFARLVDKFGALNKDNGYTRIKVQSGERYNPETMPEDVLAQLNQGIVVSDNVVAFRGAWIKTYLAHSLTDKCVRFRFGRAGEDKHVFVEIMQYTPDHYPYKANQ